MGLLCSLFTHLSTFNDAAGHILERTLNTNPAPLTPGSKKDSASSLRQGDYLKHDWPQMFCHPKELFSIFWKGNTHSSVAECLQCMYQVPKSISNYLYGRAGDLGTCYQYWVSWGMDLTQLLVLIWKVHPKDLLQYYRGCQGTACILHHWHAKECQSSLKTGIWSRQRERECALKSKHPSISWVGWIRNCWRSQGILCACRAVQGLAIALPASQPGSGTK